MSCRNSEFELLKNAIYSVLNQTYNKFELIIIDDGSEIPIESYIHSISKDQRIAVHHIKPSGLGAALNFGISISKGNYIARFDDDDLMCNDRLQKQVKFLDFHKDVVCVGTQHYDKVKNKYIKHRKYPTKHDYILKDLLNLKWAMAHTTLMFRKESFNKIGGYRVKGGGQDLDLMLQMSTVGELANIDEYLNYYFMSGTGLSVNNSNKYKAYLFALESIKKSEIYCQFDEIIDKSISKTIEIINKNSERVPIKRYLLMYKVSLFGKKIRN